MRYFVNIPCPECGRVRTVKVQCPWHEARVRAVRCRACANRAAAAGGGSRGLGRDVHAPPLPARPTDTPPGSPERMAVYGERCERGEQLFHPDDRRGSAWAGWTG